MAGKTVRKKQTAAAPQQGWDANVNWKTGAWILLGIIIGGFFVLRGCGPSDGGGDLDYKYTIYDSTVNRDGITVKAITAVAAPSLSEGSYKAIARDIAEKHMSGCNGGIWVFDDAQAQQLQWKAGLQWKREPVDLNAEEESYYEQHHRAQATIKVGEIRALEEYR